MHPQRRLGRRYGVLDGGRLMDGLYHPQATWIQPPAADSLAEVEELCLAYAAELHATGGLLADWRPTIAEAARRIARHAHTSEPDGFRLDRELARIAGAAVEIEQLLGDDDQPPEAPDQQDRLDAASPPDTGAPSPADPLPIPGRGAGAR